MSMVHPRPVMQFMSAMRMSNSLVSVFLWRRIVNSSVAACARKYWFWVVGAHFSSTGLSNTVTCQLRLSLCPGSVMVWWWV